MVEPLGLLFALVASGLWIVTTVYSIGYMRGHRERNQTRFYAFFAVSIASTMGVAFAGNMLTLFVFYEALTLATFPLVTHAGTPEARRAGRIYLGVLLGTSIGLQLLAIAGTYAVAGTLDFTPGGVFGEEIDGVVAGALLALYVFGIGKAAIMPFHRWLPAAMVAPTPVSALLHAVAVVKSGVFAVLKVTTFVFGFDLLRDLAMTDALQWAAAFTVVAASLAAMTKDNLKARLAYSTVSQLAYIVLAALLANEAGFLGGSLHIATHAFGKITLFFCAGAILGRRPQDRGLATRRAGPGHARHDDGLRDRRAQQRRAAAPGRDLEQVAHRGRRARGRPDRAGRRALPEHPAQRRVPAADPRARLPARSAEERGAGNRARRRFPALSRSRSRRSVASPCFSSPIPWPASWTALPERAHERRQDQRRQDPPVRQSEKRDTGDPDALRLLRHRLRGRFRRPPPRRPSLGGAAGVLRVYGLVACVVLVLAAKELRKAVMRGEDHYDD